MFFYFFNLYLYIDDKEIKGLSNYLQYVVTENKSSDYSIDVVKMLGVNLLSRVKKYKPTILFLDHLLADSCLLDHITNTLCMVDGGFLKYKNTMETYTQALQSLARSLSSLVQTNHRLFINLTRYGLYKPCSALIRKYGFTTDYEQMDLIIELMSLVIDPTRENYDTLSTLVVDNKQKVRRAVKNPFNYQTILNVAVDSGLITPYTIPQLKLLNDIGADFYNIPRLGKHANTILAHATRSTIFNIGIIHFIHY